MDIGSTKRKHETGEKQEIQKQCWRRKDYRVNEKNNENG